MTKLKLLRNIALALLPLMLYTGLFLAFEPNNYFGLKAKADGTDIMAALRTYEAQPQNAIILGDSRTAKFDPQLLEDITGHAWANLSYGGASLTEQLDLLNWARQKNPALSEVVFMASFYTLNTGYSHDRQVVRAAGNPLAYLTSLGYNINMLTNLYDHLVPGREVGGQGETEDPADYQYTEFTDPATGLSHTIRQTMADHLAGILGRAQGWALNQEQLARLCEAIEACLADGVRFTVVLPPASSEVHEFVIGSLGIAPQMAPALAALHASGALVLDYEFTLTDTLEQTQFYDGFHLDLERGLAPWTQQLFTAITEDGDGT